MHSVYHFYLVNQPNFVFIIFKISCSCALYSLHLECNLYPHLVIEIIIYILFRRYILISMIPILTNTNNTIKFTSRYSLITSPSTAIPERLPSKNIWEILSLIFWPQIYDIYDKSDTAFFIRFLFFHAPSVLIRIHPYRIHFQFFSCK